MTAAAARPALDLPSTITSPFIPGTSLQFAWDSVSFGTALSCWRKYQLTIIEGWEKNSGESAIALNFGILFHYGMQFYEEAKAAGMDHEEAMRFSLRKLLAHPRTALLPTQIEVSELKETTDPDDDGITLRNSKIRTRYHLFRSVVWYLDHYHPDPAKTYILSDGSAAVELSFRIPVPVPSVPEHEFILAGHLDRVAAYDKDLYVIDYKTTKSLSSQFFANWALAHQLSGYTYAGKVALNVPVKGVIVDGIALQVGGVKFGRAETPRTRGQINEFFANLDWVVYQANYLSKRLADDPDFQYPMNTQSCYFCELKDVCRQPPEFRRRYLKMHFTQVPAWNPLANR